MLTIVGKFGQDRKETLAINHRRFFLYTGQHFYCKQRKPGQQILLSPIPEMCRFYKKKLFVEHQNAVMSDSENM